MNDDKDKNITQKQSADEIYHQVPEVHNPLKNEDKNITQEDVENEQAFKEAQTERD